jgi:hypothetical protein
MGKTFNTGTLVNGLSTDASGNVGINTSSPAYRLDVTGTGRFTGTLIVETSSSPGLNIIKDASVDNRYIRLTNSQASSKNWDIINQTNSLSNNFQIFNSTDGVSGLTITPTGNIGIGTTSPTTRLTIGRVDSTNEGGQIDLCRASDNTNAFGIDVFGNTTAPSLRFIDNVASAARMVITGTGNVGIGTTAPDNLLDVYGTATNTTRIRVRGTTNFALFQAQNDSSSAFYLGIDSSTASGFNVGNYSRCIWSGGAYPLVFATNDVERMRITSGGDITMGSGGQIQTTGGYFRLRTSTGTTTGLIIQKSTWTGSGSDFTMSFAAEGGYGLSFFTNGSATERMTLTTGGNLIVNSGYTYINGEGNGLAIDSGTASVARTGFMKYPGFEGMLVSGSGTKVRLCHRVDSDYVIGGTPSIREDLVIQTNGAVTIPGSLSKGSGSFKIDHPLDSKKDTHHLVHSFVESPQANNIYRGKVQLVNGSAEINLDEVSTMTEGTFVLLNREIHTYTSNETDWDAVRGKVEGNILIIECQNNQSNAVVSWLVIGERQDKHIMDTDWTDDNGKVIVEPLKD